jgi:hypothetical protein
MNKNRSASRLLTLIEQLDKGLVKPDTLSPRLRRKIVQFFVEEQSEATNRSVARICGVSDSHVARLKRQLIRSSSWMIDDLDVKEIATELKIRKTELQGRAIKTGDYGLAWRIECEFIDKMAELGYIAKVPDRVLVGVVDLENRLKEFFNEFGVPTAEAFLRSLRELQSGNGRGDRRVLDVAHQLVGAAGGAAQPEGKGPEDGR